MSTNDLTPEQLAVIDKAQKLLNLGAKNPNQHEAAAATAKAMALLAQYNLDMGAVESNKEGKREQAMVEGGTFSHQRELWKAVAELNFCIYWSQQYLTDPIKGEPLSRVKRRRHALIGRTVNVTGTKAMAGYLQDAIERVLTERLSENDEQRHSNWAWSFRKGAASTIIAKLVDRRDDMRVQEAREIKRKMKEAAAHGSNASSGTALTLAGYAKSEEEANQDFIHGEGYSARKAAERAKEAKHQRDMENAYTRWAAVNPRAALADFEFVDEEGLRWHYGRPRYTGSTQRTSNENIDDGGYRAGREAGAGIGLDAQAEGRKEPKGRIAGPKAMHI